MAEEKHSFQAEVSRLLQIVANSLYSDKQIFLRELISNASDACDRLRYESITKPELTADDAEFRVRIAIDKKSRTIELTDNGIGMNREALIDDLGTIARSGTSAYLEQLTGDSGNDLALIGQFGVGFYSVFMVAEHVEVLSRRAGEDQGWCWTSDGTGEFTVVEAEKPDRGTNVRMKLRKGEDTFLDPATLERIVKTYSDHIALPIILERDGNEETINKASAIWRRPKKDVSEDDYKEFYHHVGHVFDDPWLTLHWRAEGKLEYTTLLFVPSSRPFDLFHPERHHRVKLYVKRIFITDDCEGLVPHWLRFLRGLVDSEDLPLNVSRELLQNNPMVARMRGAIVKRVLAELSKKAEKDAEAYAAFWTNFGALIKEGIYEDADNRESLIKIARFQSTAGESPISLSDYVERMKDGQEAIYYITGEDIDSLRKSPQLEGFAARDVEVLLLTDPVDEFWIPAVGEFESKPLKSATRGGSDLGSISVADGKGEAAAEPEPANQGRIDSLIAMFKLTLQDEVKDVRTSDRLTDSAACLVADEGDLDINLERLLKQHNQLGAAASKRILEINATHPLIETLADRVGKDASNDRLNDAAWLVLDQARIMEGESLPDPGAFARRLSDALTRGLA